MLTTDPPERAFESDVKGVNSRYREENTWLVVRLQVRFKIQPILRRTTKMVEIAAKIVDESRLDLPYLN